MSLYTWNDTLLVGSDSGVYAFSIGGELLGERNPGPVRQVFAAVTRF